MKTPAERLTFYKELYYREIDRRKDFNNAISVPIALLTGVFSILFYVISVYDFSQWIFQDFLFLASVFISFVLFIVSGFHTIKFYANIDAGFKTIEIPGPLQIEKYRLDLLDYHKDIEETDKKLTDWLISEYLASAENYQINNDLKARHFFKFKRYFIYGMTILIFSGFLFMLNFIRERDHKTGSIHISLEIPDLKLKSGFVLSGDSLKKDSVKLTIKK